MRPGKNGDRYYVYWRPTPGAKQKAKVSHDRAEAEAFLLEKEGAAPDPSAIPFSMFWTRYIAERATKKLTPKVLGTYTRTGVRLLLPFFSDKPLSSITRSDIPAWITWAERGLARGASTRRTPCSRRA